MFAKQQAKPRPAKGQLPAPMGGDLSSSRKPPRVASVVADDMTLEGGVNGAGELHVDGVVKGDIRIGKLSLGETGHIEGNVYAETVEARGRIIGSITAKTVRLFATAYIDGDVTHEQLAMETGAFFQGRAQKLQRPTASPAGEVVALPSLKAGE